MRIWSEPDISLERLMRAALRLALLSALFLSLMVPIMISNIITTVTAAAPMAMSFNILQWLDIKPFTLPASAADNASSAFVPADTSPVASAVLSVTATALPSAAVSAV